MSKTYAIGITFGFVVMTAAFTAAFTPLVGSVLLAVMPALFVALGISLTTHFAQPRKRDGGDKSGRTP